MSGQHNNTATPDIARGQQEPVRVLDPIDRMQSWTKPRNILLIGFYGRGNFGDDVMGKTLAGYALATRHCEVSIVTADEQVFAGAMEDNSLLYLPHSAWAVLKSLGSCEVLLQGGGTNFHDSFRGRYLVRHWAALAKWIVLFWAARAHGAKVAMAGAGVGPLRHPVSRWLARMAFTACTSINVRDRASVEELEKLGIRKPVYLGFDLAALANSDAHPFRSGRPKKQPVLGISACTLTPFLNSKEENEEYWQVMGDALACFAQTEPVRLRFFSLFSGTSAEKDDAVIDIIVSRLPEHIPYERHVYAGNVEEFTDLFRDCDWFIGTKYHAAMLAYLSGCDCAIVSYNRKMTDLADEIGLPEERRVAANRVQPHKKWEELFHSLGKQAAGTVNPVEFAKRRAMEGTNAVFDSVGLIAKEGPSQ